MENFILKYWPQIVFVSTTLFSLGKLWQSTNVMCTTLKEHSHTLAALKEYKSSYMSEKECEKIRGVCIMQQEKTVQEIKTLIMSMDSKRETSRDDIINQLNEISQRLARIEGKVASVYNFNGVN